MSCLCCVVAPGGEAFGQPPPASSAFAPKAEQCAQAALDDIAPPESQTPNSTAEKTEKTKKEQQEQQERAEQLEKFRKDRRSCLKVRAHLSVGPDAVATEVLRSVAQVIVSRVTRAGWQVLDAKLKEAARCPAPGKDAKLVAPSSGTPAATTTPTSFPATCEVLDTVSIKDLVASPTVLLNAVVHDFLVQANVDPTGLKELAPLFYDVLAETAIQWNQRGPASLVDALQQGFKKNLEASAEPECNDPLFAKKALWVAGMCMIEAGTAERFPTCHVDEWVNKCGKEMEAPLKAGILRIWSIVGKIQASIKKPKADDYIELTFTLADLALDIDKAMPAEKKAIAREYIVGARAVFLGISDKDWVQATSGAVRVVRVIHKTYTACAADSAGAECVEARKVEKVFTLLSAVGNYALTFASDSKDVAAANAEREKIIEELVDRMVNRTDREHGLVVSIGGNLGLLGGARTTDFKTAQVAFPLQLGIGIGIQSYGSNSGGFHGMLTAIDLGQYVSLQNDALTVEAPKVESAVMLGATLGGWAALRETPYYIGGFGGLSPFVRKNEKMTYQLGIVTGIYVPLLDFN